jgi:hypothetical protein
MTAEESEKMRPIAAKFKERKMRYKNAEVAQGVPVVGPKPPPEGWKWHGCGGVFGSSGHSVNGAMT